MIKITTEKQDELQDLLSKGFVNTVSDIKDTLKVNSEAYSDTDDGSGFSQADGYGFAIYLVRGVQDYVNTMQNLNLFFTNTLESEVTITEDDKEKISIRQLFILGSDDGCVLYLMD